MFSAVDLGAVRVFTGSISDSLGWLESWLLRGQRGFVCFCEASLLSKVISDEKVRDCVAKAAMVFADGVALAALARIQGHKLGSRVPGPTFILAACEHGLSRGWRHFFYGGAPGVAKKLAEQLSTEFPGIIVAGTHSPPFRQLTSSEESDVRQMIEASRPDLLWVCLGSPKQELWCADHVGLLDVPIMLPVGAAFDFHSGHRPWAPAWVRCIGMEWLFRTFTGGLRTFFRNVRCVTVVAGILLRAAARRLTG